MIRAVILSASFAALASLAPVPTAAQARESASPRGAVTEANQTALREPSGDGYLGALQIYPYAEGMLYRLYAAPERVTDLALQPGETVVSVAAGDTARWTVGDTASGSGERERTHILVKPFSAGLETNLVIMTDRRVYRLQLTSTPASAMTAVAWTYPQDELIALRRRQEEAEAARPVAAGVALEALNFDYRITGDKPAWRPLRAFDDGRQTYIEFAPGIAEGEAPPLFVLGPAGEAQLVNYRMAGRYYVIDRLFGAAELRLGAKKQQVVRITRLEPGARRRAGRGS